MLMQWLEPMIVKRVQQVSDENCADMLIGSNIDQFIDIMEQIQPFVTEEFYLDTVMKMEEILNLVCFLSEDGAYRKGLMDGMALQYDMNNVASHPKFNTPDRKNKIENEKKPSVSLQATEDFRTTG